MMYWYQALKVIIGINMDDVLIMYWYQALKVITGASKHDLRCVGSGLPLSESGTQMMLEIFSSIGSAAPEGSSSLLGAIPAALDLMLTTKGYTRMHRHPPPHTHGHSLMYRDLQ